MEHLAVSKQALDIVFVARGVLAVLGILALAYDVIGEIWLRTATQWLAYGVIGAFVVSIGYGSLFLAHLLDLTQLPLTLFVGFSNGIIGGFIPAISRQAAQNRANERAHAEQLSRATTEL